MEWIQLEYPVSHPTVITVEPARDEVLLGIKKQQELTPLSESKVENPELISKSASKYNQPPLITFKHAMGSVQIPIDCTEEVQNYLDQIVGQSTNCVAFVADEKVFVMPKVWYAELYKYLQSEELKMKIEKILEMYRQHFSHAHAHFPFKEIPEA